VNVKAGNRTWEELSCPETLRRTAALSALALAVTVAFWRPFSDLLILAQTADAYTHILLILPLSLAMLITSRRAVFQKTKWALTPALAMGTAGALLEIGSQISTSHHLGVSIAAMVLFWQAAFVLCLGTQAFRAGRFPMFFLFLLVPPAPSLVNAMVSVLQRGSAEVAYRLLQIAAIPVGRDGLVLFLPGLNIEVAAECSSIRSSALLFVTSLVITHTFLRCTWKKMLVGILVLPIAMLKNGIRIFALSALAVYADPAILSSWVHHSGGFLFFLLGVAMVAFVIWMLAPPSRTRAICSSAV